MVGGRCDGCALGCLLGWKIGEAVGDLDDCSEGLMDSLELSSNLGWSVGKEDAHVVVEGDGTVDGSLDG